MTADPERFGGDSSTASMLSQGFAAGNLFEFEEIQSRKT